MVIKVDKDTAKLAICKLLGLEYVQSPKINSKGGLIRNLMLTYDTIIFDFDNTTKGD